MKNRALLFTLLVFLGNLIFTSFAAAATSPITGTFKICVGGTTTLNDAATGTWSSGTPSVATIGSGTGVVSGVAGGTAMITFTASTGIATQIITVDPVPVAGVILGDDTSVCQGATISLSDIATGGVWSSSATSIATVASTGIVSGTGGGTATISYSVSNSCGTVRATCVVTVNPLPVVPAITGINDICLGSSTTLFDGTAGGVWSSSVPAVATVGSSGLVSSISAGSTRITYAVTNGCGTIRATRTVSVDTVVTSLVVSGPINVCQHANVTLTGSPAAGSWVSSAPSVATVGSSSGVVGGVAVGPATITYLFSNACGSWTTTAGITVDSLPYPGIITGQQVLCAGELTELHDDQEPIGEWSSGSTAKATVMSNGYVTGVSGGTVTLSYTVTEPTYHCFQSATYVMTINALPNPVLVTTGNVHLATTLSYTAYNWLNAGAYIGGATAPTYTIIMPGVYSVRVTDGNGCSNNSATYSYPATSVQNVNGTGIRIYPNPTNGFISVESANSTDLQITSIDGRTLAFVSDANQLDLKSYAAGTYILSVFDHITGVKLTTEKILKTGN